MAGGIEHERRFLIKPEFVPPWVDWPVPFEPSKIEQVYLRCSHGVDRIRRRFWIEKRKTEYDRTQKVKIDAVRVQETVTEINSAEFLMLGVLQDPLTEPIHKWRRVFEWDGVTWELDMFTTPARIVILEVEIQDFPDRGINLPDFLGPLTEVTGDPLWSNKSMSMKTWVAPIR